MAKFVLKNAGVKLGGAEIVAKSLTIDMTVDAPDVTDFGQLTRHYLAGLKSWSGSFEVNQDYANSVTDEDIWAKTEGVYECDFTNDRNNSNTDQVILRGDAIITGYTPATGTVGDAAGANVTFQGSGKLEQNPTGVSW